MQSFETLENGATGDVLIQHMAQAQLASSLVDDLYEYIVEPQEEDEKDETD